MKTTQCDLCGGIEPKVYCRYSFRKKWAWRRFNDYPQKRSYEELDICERCWEYLQDTVKIEKAKAKAEGRSDGSL